MREALPNYNAIMVAFLLVETQSGQDIVSDEDMEGAEPDLFTALFHRFFLRLAREASSTYDNRGSHSYCRQAVVGTSKLDDPDIPCAQGTKSNLSNLVQAMDGMQEQETGCMTSEFNDTSKEVDAVRKRLGSPELMRN